MSGIKTAQLTPLMRQYFEIKNNFQDSLLLFQVGDFYELFFDDAKKAASFLNITLTKRGNVNGEPIPLCGVPVHTVDHYLSKLIKGGYKVAICDQLEEAVPGKVVLRGITTVLTPGTLTDSKLLDEKSASYLFSFFPASNAWGLLFGELLTARLYATFIPSRAFKVLEGELSRFFPDEIIIPNNKEGKDLENYFKQLGYFATMTRIQELHEHEQTDFNNWLNSQFNSDVLRVINENNVLKLSVHNFYNYLKKNQEFSLEQFNKVNFYRPEDFLLLDASTQKNLEIVKNNNDGTGKNSLFELLDKASTSMGSRMIKKWILRPLIKKDLIIQRQDTLEFLIKELIIKQNLISCFNLIPDVERIVGRIALKRAGFNDYIALARALAVIPKIKNILRENKTELLSLIDSEIFDFSELKNLLNNSLNDDLSKDWIIKNRFDENLDKYRQLIENSNNKILELEKKEQLSTGISSLKIRYNQVQGYYIEVTKTNLNLVPDHYIRNQTLSGKERFLTTELQILQMEIEDARNEIKRTEENIFEKIKIEVYEHISGLRRVANALANLDALIGLANVAYENGYVRPTFNVKQEILIEEGRHPIVEHIIGNKFIPNSCELTDKEALWIITGPNMGGKSTYLRQVALICILAQCGSFVPAKNASLPILDRIFTRIGAGDNLADGKSTFLVEMEETASICNHATEKSLVILDEVGRGTSTYDGLAIAQAVVEHIYLNIKARCLFATHYHELTTLQDKFDGIAAYYMASQKTQTGILFLHKIVKGRADGSYGIEVAKLANLPPDLIKRSMEILSEFNISSVKIDNNNTLKEKKLIAEVEQLEKQLINKNQIIAKLKQINFDELSPKKAFDLIWEIRNEKHFWENCK